MDSVTQAVLGASVAGVCAPAGYRRQALLAGVVLGTVPDLDVFIDYGDAVRNFTFHRGFSHSLFVLAPFSVLLWGMLCKFWQPSRAAPGRWLAAISLPLLTHPLLDAHTAYGTQLWWPLSTPPTSWSTLFIIDPLYTLPLLAAVLAVSFKPRAQWSATALSLALATSTAYMGWSWVARSIVQEHAATAMVAAGLANAPVFLTPTPFNTLLWRVLVMTPDGYLEGFDSLVLDEGPMRFVAHESDRQAMEAASTVWAVQRLRWFSQDFLRATVTGNQLILSDLRMGQEPDYVFGFIVAERGNPHWTEIIPEPSPSQFSFDNLDQVWRRIWSY